MEKLIPGYTVNIEAVHQQDQRSTAMLNHSTNANEQTVEEPNIEQHKEQLEQLLLTNEQNDQHLPIDDDVPILNVLSDGDEKEKAFQEGKFYDNDYDPRLIVQSMKEHMEILRNLENCKTQIIELSKAKSVEDTDLASNYRTVFDFAIITVVFNIVVPFCGLVVFLRAVFFY